ncbi:hypothetical protein CVT24_003235 [Panaeolus cyanescens]|uniref:Inhibitor I9 domain-containing protein n=1 Tax=Panaeolus cyanescens TaxID=181874 RepID=A0A409YRF1_9AGAR|nr:hypothetical protein CVT24_003235 [Panaeolus cyanescens]
MSSEQTTSIIESSDTSSAVHVNEPKPTPTNPQNQHKKQVYMIGVKDEQLDAVLQELKSRPSFSEAQIQHVYRGIDMFSEVFDGETLKFLEEHPDVEVVTKNGPIQINH